MARGSDPGGGRPEAASLEELIERNLGWLRGWVGARLRGSRRQDLDDICQEIVLRAVRGASVLRDPARFPAWLYRIANNVLRDHLRRQKVRERDRAPIRFEPVDPRPGVPDIEAAEDLERTVEALLALPRRYREPMLLRHVEDLGYAEIGRILGISENAVQVRIFRARKMLLAALEQRANGAPSGRPAARDRGRRAPSETGTRS